MLILISKIYFWCNKILILLLVQYCRNSCCRINKRLSCKSSKWLTVVLFRQLSVHVPVQKKVRMSMTVPVMRPTTVTEHMSLEVWQFTGSGHCVYLLTWFPSEPVCRTLTYARSRDFSLVTANLRSFLPARRYASAGNRDRNVSVCLSVCLSVRHAPVLCQNEESVTISSPCGSPMILVFGRQISSKILRDSPRTGASKKGG